MPRKVSSSGVKPARRSDLVFFMVVGGIVLLVIAYAAVSAIRSANGRTPQATAVPTPIEVRRVSVEDARAQADAGTAILVDTRSAEYYARQHAQGALSLPEDQAVEIMPTLPQDKLLILYCT